MPSRETGRWEPESRCWALSLLVSSVSFTDNSNTTLQGTSLTKHSSPQMLTPGSPVAPVETEIRTLLLQPQLVPLDTSKYLGSKCLVIQRSHRLISYMSKKNDITKQLPPLPASPATPPDHWLPCIHPSLLHSGGPLTSQSAGPANTYQ